jgi:hypothetical protein
MASALPRWVDTHFLANGAVITRTSVFAPSIGVSARLTADFDKFGPPNNVNTVVPAQHAALARALILTLGMNSVRER